MLKLSLNCQVSFQQKSRSCNYQALLTDGDNLHHNLYNSVYKQIFQILQDFVPTFLENLTDDELKKEAKNEAKNDALSSIIKVFFKKILSAEFFVKSLTPSLTFFHMATW